MAKTLLGMSKPNVLAALLECFSLCSRMPYLPGFVHYKICVLPDELEESMTESNSGQGEPGCVQHLLKSTFEL